MEFMENGLVPPGRVVVFISKDNTYSILQAGDPFITPPGGPSGAILQLNEKLDIQSLGVQKRIRNMGGRAMIDEEIPAGLFPEFGS